MCLTYHVDLLLSLELPLEVMLAMVDLELLIIHEFHSSNPLTLHYHIHDLGGVVVLLLELNRMVPLHCVHLVNENKIKKKQ